MSNVVRWYVSAIQKMMIHPAIRCQGQHLRLFHLWAALEINFIRNWCHSHADDNGGNKQSTEVIASHMQPWHADPVHGCGLEGRLSTAQLTWHLRHSPCTSNSCNAFTLEHRQWCRAKAHNLQCIYPRLPQTTTWRHPHDTTEYWIWVSVHAPSWPFSLQVLPFLYVRDHRHESFLQVRGHRHT